MTNIDIACPIVDNTQSISSIKFEPSAFTSSNNTGDIVINNAFKNRNNTLFLIFIMTSSSTVTLKGGNKYPNSKLGDLTFPVDGCTCVQIQDPSRFEQSDGSLIMNFATSFDGTVLATAKSTDILPANIE